MVGLRSVSQIYVDVLELLPSLHSFLLRVTTEPPAQNCLTAPDASVDVDLDIHIFTKDWVKIILKLLQFAFPMRQHGRRIVVEQNPSILEDTKRRQTLQPKVNMDKMVIKAHIHSLAK
jgi:hypothetical protein